MRYLSYVFSFSSYICFLTNFELIFVYEMRQGSNSFFFFTCGYPIVSALFVGKTISPLIGTFVNVRTYFCTPNHFSLIYISFVSTTLFDFCIIISFKIEKISPLSVYFKWFELFSVLIISI